MIPVRTNRSNFVYRGPTPDVGDAWVERRRAGEVYLSWKPSDEERAAIAAGGLIELGIHGREPIPPVSLNVSEAIELDAIGIAMRDRAQQELKKIARGIDLVPPGYWAVSEDVWLALCEHNALDTSGTGDLPALFGRPLMQLVGPAPDFMEYVSGAAS